MYIVNAVRTSLKSLTLGTTVLDMTSCIFLKICHFAEGVQPPVNTTAFVCLLWTAKQACLYYRHTLYTVRPVCDVTMYRTTELPNVSFHDSESMAITFVFLNFFLNMFFKFKKMLTVKLTVLTQAETKCS